MERLRTRLCNQYIARPATTATEVVERLGALQAQDFPGAAWSLGLRLAGATAGDVAEAIAGRAIVRTWLMRGTLHIAPAADIRWMLDLCAPRLIAGSESRRRQLGLTDALIARSRELLTAALEGGRQKTRAELYTLLQHAGIATEQRGYHLLWRAGLDGLLCFGPHDDKQPTFALLEEWAPVARRPDRDEALGLLARRYFSGHGPATLHDFAWWSGLLMGDARRGLDIAAPDLVQVVIDGTAHWTAADTPTPETMAHAFLLPGFDEYMLGYKDRSAALDPQYAQRIVPGNNGMFLPTIVLDGRIAGIWKRTINKRSVNITLHPFTPPGPDDLEHIAQAAARYGAYLGLPARLQT